MNTHYGTYPGALQDLREAIPEGERGLLRTLVAVEDDELAGASLRKFPHGEASGGAIDWAAAGSIEQALEEDYLEASRRFSEFILRYASPESDAVIFWGNIAIPTVRLPARLAAENAGELIDTGDDVWIYLAEEGILVEYWHSGMITVAKIPVDR